MSNYRRLKQGRNTYIVSAMWTSKRDNQFKYLSMDEVKANSEAVAIKKYIRYATSRGHFAQDMFIEYLAYDIKAIQK